MVRHARGCLALLAALGRSSLREPILESIGKIGNVQTLTPLITGIADSLRIVREVSVVALTTIFRKSGPSERTTIIEGMKTAASDRVVAFLEELLLTSGGEIQKAAVSVLGWTGKDSSIHKLLSLLQEEDLVGPMRGVADRAVPLLYRNMFCL